MKLIWQDEFEDDQLDETKWEPRPDGKRKGGWWSPRAISLDGDGHLVITTFLDDGKPTTGCVWTKGRFEHSFGYYVARVKFQKQPGHWSAFWINGVGIGKVGNGGRDGTEIDIMEKPWLDDRVQHTFHWDGYGEHHKSEGKVVKVPGVMEGWHTSFLGGLRPVSMISWMQGSIVMSRCNLLVAFLLFVQAAAFAEEQRPVPLKVLFIGNMKLAIHFLSIVIVALALVGRISEANADDRPNIILLLADDLGYGDLSCFGSPAVKTPHLDKLASEGMRFSRFYAGSAVCSPTRASVLTGRYPLRFGITKHFNDVNRWLPESATTVAELLKGAGYNTAHVGKWHLGGLHVDAQGGDWTISLARVSTGSISIRRRSSSSLFAAAWVEIEPSFDRAEPCSSATTNRSARMIRTHSKHLTDANGDFAIELIEKLSADQKPFFINLWWLVPHKPYEPAPEPHWSNTTADGISEDQHCFRSMVQHMDAKVGQILEQARRTGNRGQHTRPLHERQWSSLRRLHRRAEGWQDRLARRGTSRTDGGAVASGDSSRSNIRCVWPHE